MGALAFRRLYVLRRILIKIRVTRTKKKQEGEKRPFVVKKIKDFINY